MPFAIAPPDYCLVRSEAALFGGYQAIKFRGRLRTTFDVTRRPVSVLRFGQTAYPLHQPTQGRFSPVSSGRGGEFTVDGFPRIIIGRGDTPEAAYRDWLEQFHASFQRLYTMRPFEMSDTEKRLWTVIESQVDVEQYRASQPLIVLQQGKVGRARPLPQVVIWEDGTKERIDLARMPGEFAGYKSGQPFEALVHRHPLTHKIIKVEYVKRLRSPQHMTAEESERLWNSLPTSATLPDTSWD